MKKLGLLIATALLLSTTAMAQESGPAAGSIGVGYYGWIQNSSALDVRYQITDNMGVLVGLGFALIDAQEFGIAAEFIYNFADAGAVKAQLAPGIEIGIPEVGDNEIYIHLPLRAEYFPAKNFSIHTAAGLLLGLNNNKVLSTYGDILGTAGFTLWL